MNFSVARISQIIFALFCIGFGIDKFAGFLPACSLNNYLPSSSMMMTGVLEIIIGILLLFNLYTLPVLRLATAIMFGGVLLHLIMGTYDLGGAVIGSIFGLVLILRKKL